MQGVCVERCQYDWKEVVGVSRVLMGWGFVGVSKKEQVGI